MGSMPRRLASKVKWSPPGRLLRTTTESTAGFARGYRYAKGLEDPVAADPPFPWSIASNPLEDYFDAHTQGAGLWKWRHYFDVYDRHLSKFCGTSARMVEIGVFGGGSLTMWRHYLGPTCQVYGVDIDADCRKHAAEGVEVLIGDQSDPEFWADFVANVSPVDIVLDDGGHQARQQIPTLEALLPHLRPGGVYICEDVHDPFHPFHAYVDGLARPLHAVPPPGRPAPASGLQQHVASVHRYPLLTVIEKPTRRVSGFEAPRHGTQWPAGR